MELQAGVPSSVGMSERGLAAARGVLERSIEQGQASAIVAVVARRGVIVMQEAFGVQHPDGEQPVQLDTIFPLSSLTKPLTATALMCLVEDGLVSMNRPVGEYLPEISGQWTGELQVHHLLTHTSGYSDELNTQHVNRNLDRGFERSAPDATQLPRVHEFLELTWDAPLARPPGKEMGYCNHNYRLLGEIVRRVAGCSLDQFARERIFDPLGMADTHYVTPDEKRERVVGRPDDAPFMRLTDFPPMIRAPERFFGVLGSVEHQRNSHAYGGAQGTALDLARFLQAYLNGGTLGGQRILSRPTVEEMTRNHVPGIGAQFLNQWYDEASWGLGWRISSNEKWAYDSELAGLGAFMHQGAGGTMMWTVAREDLLGVFFSTALKQLPSGLLDWSADLFQNAVIASIDD